MFLPLRCRCARRGSEIYPRSQPRPTQDCVNTPSLINAERSPVSWLLVGTNHNLATRVKSVAVSHSHSVMTNYYLIIHSHSFKSRGCGRCHSFSLVINRLRPPRSCAYDYFLLKHSFSPIDRVRSPRTSRAPMPNCLFIHKLRLW